MRPDSAAQAGTAPATGKILLQASHLSKSFGGVRAVQDISLGIPENSIYAIIGPNGAGKSTMLNLLSGVYRANQGSMHYDGQEISALPLHRRVRLGISRTFQKIRLFKHLTVLENVLAGFHLHHEIPWLQYAIPGRAYHQDAETSNAQAYELLEFVGLTARAQANAGSLAYGEQRMLEIARALATRPRLFLLDEPAAGLNPTEVEFLVQQLKKLLDRGITLVVVEHNMDLVMSIADHVFVMNHGEYLFDGPPEEVQQQPEVISAYLGVEEDAE
jgi:ABC-type branched-subunit amino acid transport system ATPase component